MINMILAIISLFLSPTTYTTNTEDALLDSLFPHFKFTCDPYGETYETEFSFLQGLGHGFVHAEPHRIFFEYYFPAEHWVGFSTADQQILGEKDACSLCYFTNYYPLSPTNKNHSNLYPSCIEECLDDVIFVATVNADEQNIANWWNIIEFQIGAQQSKKLSKKMYRIPTVDDLLEIWGNDKYPYREYSHFESETIPITVGSEEKDFIHSRFWRKYDYGESDSNEWKPFVIGPFDNSNNLTYPDTFCFLSIGSFYGGEYPYDDDALRGMLPGFYIDTQHLANIHCYKRNDIKVDCGQDWSFLTPTGTDMDTDTDLDADLTGNSDTDSAESSTTTTTTTTSSTEMLQPQKTILQPSHDEDCCSVISGTSYEDIKCLDISVSVDYISNLETQWEQTECGRVDKLPMDIETALTVDKNNCGYLWALFNQIHEICFKYPFSQKMKVFNIFKRRGAFQCFGVNTDSCIQKEHSFEFNTTVKNMKKENGLAEMINSFQMIGIIGIICVGFTVGIIGTCFNKKQIVKEQILPYDTTSGTSNQTNYKEQEGI